MKEDKTDGASSTDVDGETRKTLCQHVERPNRIILQAACGGHSGCPLNLARVCHSHINFEVNQNCSFAFSYSPHRSTVRSSPYDVSTKVTQSVTELRTQSLRRLSRQVHRFSEASSPHSAI
jgi:hypothetical protein